MSEEAPIKYHNNSLYWGLFIYLICVFVFPLPKGNIAALQIPSFALLLLILIQVLFPQFRFSKTANFIAVLVIIGSGFMTAKPLFEFS